MSEFLAEPNVSIHGPDELRAACVQECAPDPFNGPRSDYLIALIVEIEQTRFAYNRDVCDLAIQRLSLPPEAYTDPSNKRQRTEYGPLGMLVYWAQAYHRSDTLRAEGFVPFSNEAIEQAIERKQRLQFQSGAIASVGKRSNGEVFAYPKGAKKRYYIPRGEAVRFVEVSA